MTRAVISHAPSTFGAPSLAPASGQPTPAPEDKYKDRLLKYIPGEVVALYLTLTSIAATQKDLPHGVGWALVVVGIVATWYYLRFLMAVKDGIQLTVSCIAFVVWAFALG